MVQLDPRQWHRSAIENVDRANTSVKAGKVYRITANFTASLTGTAALATQLFVLIAKDTFIGGLTGVFRTVCFKGGAPNWNAWKNSASKTASYAIGTLLSGAAVPLSLFTQVVSNFNVRFHIQQGLYQLPTQRKEPKPQATQPKSERVQLRTMLVAKKETIKTQLQQAYRDRDTQNVTPALRSAVAAFKELTNLNDRNKTQPRFAPKTYLPHSIIQKLGSVAYAIESGKTENQKFVARELASLWAALRTEGWV